MTAVDFSLVGLKRAATHAAELGLELDLVHADLYDYRPPPSAFNLVLIAFMHPQVARRASVFGAAADAVAPGGHLLAIGLDASQANDGYGPGEPERRFSVDLLAGAFTGIQIERCKQVTRERETPDGLQRAVDVLAWGRRPARTAVS